MKDKDHYFMEIALLVSQQSRCLSRCVGAVLVNKRNSILATGYNGPPVNFPHCKICVRKDKKPGTNLNICYAVHAEQNAVVQCLTPFEIKKIYINYSPCLNCTLLLLNTSCDEIIFAEEYPDKNAKKVWKQMKRLWTKL